MGPASFSSELASTSEGGLVLCPANSLYNFVIPTGAKRSGEPALSLSKGTLCFQALHFCPRRFNMLLISGTLHWQAAEKVPDVAVAVEERPFSSA